MRAQLVAKTFLTAAAQHHLDMAKAHGTMADEYEKLSMASAATFHKTAAASHATAGEVCAECAKSCDKADFGDLEKSELDRLIPTQVSGVVPDVPPNIRAIPRFGAREITPPTHAANSPFDFSKLSTIEE